MFLGVRELAINGRFLTQPTTGVQRVARELTREIDRLVAAGAYDVRLRLLCEPGADVDDLNLRATNIEVVDGDRGHRWEQLRLPGALGDAALLCLGNTAPVRSLLGRTPVSVMIHDLSYRLYPEAYTRAYRFAHAAMLPLLLRCADRVITVAETERAILQSISPGVRNRIIVAQNGGWREDAPVDVASPTLGVHGDGYLLYVGSLSQRKNVAGVLQVAIRLARERGCRFVIAGSRGPILVATSTDVPVDVRDRISFVGQVEDLAALANLYRGAGCLVFPSFYEASPLPPLEAMRFGCPVVASDIPSMRERCGDAAAYCNPASVDSIVAAIGHVLDDPVFAENLKARGKRQIGQFSWRNQARTILDDLLA